MKSPKKQKRQEDRTVLILSCDGHYALQKRPSKGLLASLWQFPNADGHLSVPEAVEWVQARGLGVREILRQVEKKHIFTHIIWNMRGIYMEVRETSGDFVWFSREELEQNAALPTAFRQFWEGVDRG